MTCQKARSITYNYLVADYRYSMATLSSTSRLQLHHTGYAGMQLAGIKTGLLLISFHSEHTARLVMDSSYTDFSNRRGVEKSLCMI